MAVSLLQKAFKLQVAGGWESILGMYCAVFIILCSFVNQNKLYMCVFCKYATLFFFNGSQAVKMSSCLAVLMMI